MSLASNGTLSISTINSVLAFTGGNLGIGTSNPSSKLHLNGNMISTSMTSSNLNLSGTFNKSGVEYIDLFQLQKMNVANTVVFTSGSSTWTIPSGVTTLQVEMVGGGGSGASGRSTSTNYSGGGGGAGGYIRAMISVTAGSTISYNVGTGGAIQSTVAANGNNGSDTNITSGNIMLKASGGRGGFTNTDGLSWGSGGTGGESLVVGSSNILTVTGGEGGVAGSYIPGTAYATGGMGGASYFGSGGAGSSNDGQTIAAKVYGAGGGGGNNHPSATSGAAGGGGVIIITYFTQTNNGSGVNIPGVSAGTASITTQSSFGNYNFNLPTSSGSSGQVLLSGGGGSSAMTWSSGLTLPSFFSGSFTTTSSVSIPTTSVSGWNYLEIKGRIKVNTSGANITIGAKNTSDIFFSLTQANTAIYKYTLSGYTLESQSATNMIYSAESTDGTNDIYGLYTIKIVNPSTKKVFHYKFDCAYTYKDAGTSTSFGIGYFYNGSSSTLGNITLTASTGTITGTYTVHYSS